MSVLARNLGLLRAGADLLETLPPGIYAAPAPRLALSAAGVHLRHALEFYTCFLDGVSSGEIDYDARQREPDLETSASVARSRVEEIYERIGALEPGALGEPLQIRQDDIGDASAVASQSTVHRELQFLAAHLVHHYALMGVILRHHGAEVGEDFGVAPSTLDHWNEARAR